MQLTVYAPSQIEATQVTNVDAVSMATLLAASMVDGSSLAAVRTFKITKGASQ